MAFKGSINDTVILFKTNAADLSRTKSLLSKLAHTVQGASEVILRASDKETIGRLRMSHHVSFCFNDWKMAQRIHDILGVENILVSGPFMDGVHFPTRVKNVPVIADEKRNRPWQPESCLDFDQSLLRAGTRRQQNKLLNRPLSLALGSG